MSDMPAQRERSGAARKDRLIQTRVPRALEKTLKREAERQRLSLSHLIRNILEDAFELMDGVVADVDQIVSAASRSPAVQAYARPPVRPPRSAYTIFAGM